MSDVKLFAINEQEKQKFLKIVAASSENTALLRSGYVFDV